MRKWLARLVWVPLALLGAIFAIANREKVAVSLWPLPWEATLPLFMIMLIVLCIGLLLGGVMVWLGGHRYRATARQQTRSNENLRRQVAELKATPAPAPSLPAPDTPALPPR
jgi:putative membrane protein